MGDMAFVPEPGTWHWCLRAPPIPWTGPPCPFGPHSLFLPVYQHCPWCPGGHFCLCLNLPRAPLYVHIHLFSLCFSVPLFWRSLGPAHNAVGMGVKGAQVPLPHSTR